MLYKTDVEYGDYTLNYVSGCSHGCKYPCYAMQMAKRFGKIKSYDEWLKPKLAYNTLEILDKELPRLKDKIRFVHMCFTTDPFMVGYPEVSQLSLEVIKKINDYNLPVEVLTKGVYPKEVINVSRHSDNIFGISLISLDEDFRVEYEPYSAMYEERINSLKYLHKAGLKTWVSIEPYPTPNMCEQKIEDILEKVKFVDYIVFGRWNYNKKINQYTDYQNFYNTQCKIVREFCMKQGIKLHIKDKTEIL